MDMWPAALHDRAVDYEMLVGKNDSKSGWVDIAENGADKRHHGMWRMAPVDAKASCSLATPMSRTSPDPAAAIAAAAPAA